MELKLKNTLERAKTLIMVKYKKCPNCKRKGLYIGDGGDVCCFCGQTVPNKMYGKMGRKELEWHRRRLEERLDSGVGNVLYKNNIKWLNMTDKLNDMNIKKQWRIKYLTVCIAVIAIIISTIALFKP